MIPLAIILAGILSAVSFWRIADALRDIAGAIDRQTHLMFVEADSDGGPDDDDGEPVPEPGSNVVAIGRVA